MNRSIVVLATNSDKEKESNHEKIIEILCISLCLLVSLCACTIKSDKKMSDEEIQKLKSEYAKYLSETYPEETFTVDVWQEYSETTGAGCF